MISSHRVHYHFHDSLLATAVSIRKISSLVAGNKNEPQLSRRISFVPALVSSCEGPLDEDKFCPTELARAKKKNKATCKQCMRGKYILKTYSISSEDYDTMCQEQNQSCKICSKKLKQGISAHVDHNYGTGAVRRLLCLSCNTGIGKLEDSATTCIAAALYLLRAEQSKDQNAEWQDTITQLELSLENTCRITQGKYTCKYLIIVLTVQADTTLRYKKSLFT